MSKSIALDSCFKEAPKSKKCALKLFGVQPIFSESEDADSSICDYDLEDSKIKEAPKELSSSEISFEEYSIAAVSNRLKIDLKGASNKITGDNDKSSSDDDGDDSILSIEKRMKKLEYS